MMQERTIDIAALAGELSAGLARLPEAILGLSPSAASALVDHLKAEADRHWWINANRSLELAALIVGVGRARGDTWQVALGTMARGDALKFVGRSVEAWQTLGEAGELFRAAGDEVGWARTRIGRLVICLELNRVQEALGDAALARDIFTRHAEHERLFGLLNNIAMVHGYLGEQRSALEIYHGAQAIVEALGEGGRRHLSLLFVNMGYAHHMLGDFREASGYYERARALFEERDELRGVAVAEHNLAHVAMSQGQHRRALRLLLQARGRYEQERLGLDANHVSCDMVESYLLLNRYAEARDLAKQVIAGYRETESSYREAIALIHLATAEAHLGEFEAARAALDRAQRLFAELGAASWLEQARLRSGQIALFAGDATSAEQVATGAMATFGSSGAQVEYGSAALLRGQALMAAGRPGAALEHGQLALGIARRCNIPPLRYGAHLLLGTIAESAGDLPAAARRYTAAMATIDRVQRGLTITLRPDFLGDKGEALRRLVRLRLREGRAAPAFEALERAKSQTLLGYLANREQFRWAGAGARCRGLLDELNQLREQHQWLYRLAHEPATAEDGQQPAIAPEQALAELAARERRMRAITEELYLYSGDDRAAGVAAPRLAEVQAALDDDTLLVAFFNDGAELWAFTLTRASLEAHHLPIGVSEAGRLLAQLQANIDFALNAGRSAPATRSLANVGQRILQRLHAGLLAPLAERAASHARLIVVPYGALHYLPFHLLHSGAAYLIEQHEVAVLPAAGLAIRRGPRRPRGARILAHSWDGRLPQAQAEARDLQRLFGGEVYAEQDARRAALSAPPTQILHIAAHGEHRLDQPDLSYIELADGQLYTDDLLQHDLSYELVTLSACETGRANVAGGDELIGLGRGVLYAGAGALITSLWRVADDATLDLMGRVYGALRGGASKAAALRNAQRAVLVEDPQQHPAFWGAFQLVGDAAPLSRDAT
jgi:CHAT domain-containing protein